MQYLLAVDAGTTSVKAGLFAPDGRCLGVAREEYQLQSPAADRAELDPELYWQACIRTVREALHRSAVDPEDIKAIGVSSQGETTITLDAQGNAIYPALVWLDNRAADQAAFLAERFGKVVYARTGIPEIIPTWPACKILWIRENEPEVFARAARFVLVQDYLIYRLTGRIVTDGSISSTTLNYDILNNCWWKDVQDAIGITVRTAARDRSTGHAGRHGFAGGRFPVGINNTHRRRDRRHGPGLSARSGQEISSPAWYLRAPVQRLPSRSRSPIR